MKKFLVSSLSLRRYLMNIDGLDIGRKDAIEVTVRDDRFYVGPISVFMSVASKSDFKTYITLDQILKLRSIISYLSDQPLTINFDSSTTIEIQNILI